MPAYRRWGTELLQSTQALVHLPTYYIFVFVNVMKSQITICARSHSWGVLMQLWICETKNNKKPFHTPYKFKVVRRCAARPYLYRPSSLAPYPYRPSFQANVPLRFMRRHCDSMCSLFWYRKHQSGYLLMWWRSGYPEIPGLSYSICPNGRCQNVDVANRHFHRR